MKNFEELECWKKATELRRRLSELVQKFPEDEKSKLTDQIQRASRSVTSNIAEGFGRYDYREFAHVCRLSRGSLFELMDHLIIARDEKYVSEQEFAEFKTEIQDCLAVLNSFITYLLKTKARSRGMFEEPELSYELVSQLTFNN